MLQANIFFIDARAKSENQSGLTPCVVRSGAGQKPGDTGTDHDSVGALVCG